MSEASALSQPHTKSPDCAAGHHVALHPRCQNLKRRCWNREFVCVCGPACRSLHAHLEYGHLCVRWRRASKVCEAGIQRRVSPCQSNHIHARACLCSRVQWVKRNGCDFGMLWSGVNFRRVENTTSCLWLARHDVTERSKLPDVPRITTSSQDYLKDAVLLGCQDKMQVMT